MRKRTNGMLLEESPASLHLHHLVQGSSAQAGALRICAGALALALSTNLEIPLQPVPFTLQILALGFIAATLKPKEAASAAGAYVAAGALGAPVFAGGLGGVWRLAGPTGGFILGFVAGAWAGSYLLSQLSKTRLPWAVSCFLSCGYDGSGLSCRLGTTRACRTSFPCCSVRGRCRALRRLRPDEGGPCGIGSCGRTYRGTRGAPLGPSAISNAA